MSVVTVSVSVAEKSHAVAQAVAGAVKAIKTTLDDGWQPGQDAPAVIAAALALLPALQHAPAIPGEVDAHPKEFGAALALALADVAGLFIK